MLSFKIQTQQELELLSAAIRVLSIDSVQNAKSGHLGMPLGFADVITVLMFEQYKKNDLIVLSAGHGSILLYSIYHLLGRKDYSKFDLQNFRKLHSNTPGHPEFNKSNIITTTGPLGQGFATAVGLAIAAKKNKQEHKIYCIVGDGCLMEGISYEAASISGHLKLDNLIVLFDSNNISIDGETSLVISENQALKFKSLGWDVCIANGHKLEEISDALKNAQISNNKPYFIEFKTIIGKFCGQNIENTAKAHSGLLSIQEENLFKKNLGHKGFEKFYVKEETAEIWKNLGSKILKNYIDDGANAGNHVNTGNDKNVENNANTNAYNNINTSNNIDIKYNNFYSNNEKSISDLFTKIDTIAKKYNNTAANRNSLKLIIDEALSINQNIIFGSADLSESNCIKPSINYFPINAKDFSGNFIHYGAREHAMGAICNGLSISSYFPICGTFFVFSDYLRPSIRLASLMKLQVLYIMTHDSINVGEDGPTHQPIEHLASFRSMPNLHIFRPFLVKDLCESIKFALSYQGPSMILLPRQALNYDFLHNISFDISNYSLSSYVIEDKQESLICIITTGLDAILALKAKDILREKFNLHSIKIVIIPSITLFDQMSISNKINLLQAKYIFTLELASFLSLSFSFVKIDYQFSINVFGESGSFDSLLEYFNLTPEKIAEKIVNYIKN